MANMKKYIAHSDKIKRYLQYYNAMLGNLRIIMIHEFTPVKLKALKSIVTELDVLTWDDGLLSQYACIKSMCDVGATCFVGITTGIAETASRQAETKEYTPVIDIKCDEAHRVYRESGDAGAYMTWEHIKDLEASGAIIVGHGHQHLDVRNLPIVEQGQLVMKDTVDMRSSFMVNLGYTPSGYIYPYNYSKGILDAVIKSYGHSVRFGSERVAVETLL